MVYEKLRRWTATESKLKNRPGSDHNEKLNVFQDIYIVDHAGERVSLFH